MDEQKPKSMIEIIKEAGYVMVVRCKDCKHWAEYSQLEGTGFCPYHDGNTKYDWFCADGERKEGR